MSVTGYDFCGWATKNDLTCADGRVIRHGAFTDNDGKRVPLVWNHQHNSPDCVLGHAILENKDDGVIAYGFFNNTKQGQDAKEQVKHGDVVALSIWANNLQQVGSDVLHGVIREVSLVLSGANPGAFIESIAHANEPMEDYEDEGILYTGEELIIEHADEIKIEEPQIVHSDDKKEEPKEEEKKEEPKEEEKKEEEKKEEEKKEEAKEEPKEEDKTEDSEDSEESEDDKKKKAVETIKATIDTMDDNQKAVMHALIGAAIDDTEAKYKNTNKSNSEEEEMKHNLFEGESAEQTNFLSHADMDNIISTAKKCGSLREAFEAYTDGGELAHSIDTTGMDTAVGEQTYGFNDASMLFPDYRSLTNTPEFISRRMEWVSVVMSGVKRSPFSRVKSVFANITEDEARAKGYIKGDEKVSEVFSTLKRTTDPQTIYKLQKMDRDDIIDITDFDVVAWIKSEMRLMLDEEIARAILIGDGRLASADDKIQELHVRPIASDVPLFTIKKAVTVPSGADDSVVANTLIDDSVRARKDYKGSGSPIMFTTEGMLTEMLLLKDDIGRRLYSSESELATTLRVSRIVTVEPMEGQTISINNVDKDLLAIVVNLTDYNVGCDKGGQVSLFDDFDLNFNKYEYLIETRISGALVKPFSAISLYKNEKAS